MDNIDQRILEILQQNARITLIQLSKELHLSRPSVNERIKRLQESGVIEGFTTRISPAALGKGVQAIVQVGNLKCGCQDFERRIKEEKEVYECHRVTGTDSYYMKTAVESISHLEKLVDRLIQYGQVNTSIILSTPVDHRPLLPEIHGDD